MGWDLHLDNLEPTFREPHWTAYCSAHNCSVKSTVVETFWAAIISTIFGSHLSTKHSTHRSTQLAAISKAIGATQFLPLVSTEYST